MVPVEINAALVVGTDGGLGVAAVIPVSALALLVFAVPLRRYLGLSSKRRRRRRNDDDCDGEEEEGETTDGSASWKLCDVWTVVTCLLILAVCATCPLQGVYSDDADDGGHVEAAFVLNDGASAAVGGEGDGEGGLGHEEVTGTAGTAPADDDSAALSSHCGNALIIAATVWALKLFEVVASKRIPAQYSDVAETNYERGATKKNASTPSTKKTASSVSRARVWTLMGLDDTSVMLVVNSILLVVYVLMVYDDGKYNVVHSDPFLPYHRPLNLLRLFEWSISSPILMSLAGRSLPLLTRAARAAPSSQSHKKIRKGNGHAGDVKKIAVAQHHAEDEVYELLRPAVVLTIAYILLSYLAQIVLDFQVRCLLIVVSLIGYALCSYDQCVMWLRNVDTTAIAYRPSVFLLYAQVVCFGVYGIIFVLAFTGLIDPIVEQSLITYSDCIIKVSLAALMTASRKADTLAKTQRARLEARTSAEDLARIIDTANAPIFAVDSNQNVTIWNDKLAKLTGKSAEVILGKPLAALLDDGCRADVQGILNNCTGNSPTSEQFHCKFKQEGSGNGSNDGGKAVVSLIMTATIRHDSSNNVVGVVGVGQDLTEVTRYRSVEEKKKQLMAMISHELKSPLHGIVGLTDTLSSTEPVHSRKEKLRMILSCATRLIDMVSNIMHVSSLQSGVDETGRRMSLDNSKDGSVADAHNKTKAIRKEPINVPSIISEVCMLVGNAVDKSNRPIMSPDVELHNRISSDSKKLPVVEGDPYKVTQVFYNILQNACKFCSSGSITVTARVVQRPPSSPSSNGNKEDAADGENHRLEVNIEDTGIGIAPDAVKRIFEPFEQEEHTEIRSHGGIGLGLAISRDVVRMHGGDITVNSTPGKGSTFTVSLPVTAEAVEQAAHGDSNSSLRLEDLTDESGLSANSSSSRGGKGHRFRNHRSRKPHEKPVILSVDDDVVNQEVIKSALSDNYEIHVAMDGFEALKYFQQHNKLPDLVLLDVMMPGMTGFEVLKGIRERHRITVSDLPIIMLSAIEPVDKSIVKSLSGGASDYVTKPFDIAVLQARVRTALQITRLHHVELEHQQYSGLLHEIMPPHIVQRLITSESVISERHESVCILFADIVGWTRIAESLPTDQLISMVNELFSAFDELTEKHGVYKADTVGDAYIVAAGHDGNTKDHARRLVTFALSMLEVTKRVQMPEDYDLQIRVGIHIGPAYTGVVGKKVPKYTFFGDTVNVAARMEQTGVAGCIHLSTAARKALEYQKWATSGETCIKSSLKRKGAELVEMGEIKVKGKGRMETHMIVPDCSLSEFKSRQKLSNCSWCSSEDSNSTEDADQVIAEAQKKADDALAQVEAALKDKDLMESQLRREIESMRLELQELSSSEQETQRECQRLQQRLAQCQERQDQGRSQIRRSTSYSSFTSFRSIETNPNASTLKRHASMDGVDNIPTDLQSSDVIDKLRLQLLVTTKSLARARACIVEKEGEIDEKELLVQTMLASGNRDRRGNDDSSSVLSLHTESQQRRPSQFALRTQELLGPLIQAPNEPLGMLK